MEFTWLNGWSDVSILDLLLRLGLPYAGWRVAYMIVPAWTSMHLRCEAAVEEVFHALQKFGGTEQDASTLPVAAWLVRTRLRRRPHASLTPCAVPPSAQVRTWEVRIGLPVDWARVRAAVGVLESKEGTAGLAALAAAWVEQAAPHGCMLAGAARR
jgi:hypothetical protein